MKKRIRHDIFFLILMVTVGMACSDNNGTPDNSPPPPVAYPIKISFPGIGEHGIFDPSLTEDAATGRIWMSYSSVDTSVQWPVGNDHAVSTRLAYSDDSGETWSDSGEINGVLDVTLPLAPPNDAGTWHNEVSNVVYDPGANAGERWKLIWHHYLLINGVRHFEHGWIAIKSAGSPQDLAAATEVKLFAGKAYDTVNDTQGGTTESPVGGSPWIMLNNLFPADLSNCDAFTEPAFYATDTELYASMLCGDPSNNKVFLLKCSSPCDVSNQGSWSYQGVQLENADAVNFGYLKFSAPDLFEYNGDVYLISSPVTNSPFSNSYNGCLVFQFLDIGTGSLVESGGYPVIQKSITGDPGSFNGACAFDQSATFAWFLYSQAYPFESEVFRFFMSGEGL